MKLLSHCLGALLFFLCCCAQAHENRPLYVDIKEQGSDLYQVQIKVPPTVAHNNQPRVTLPEFCTPSGANLYRCSQSLAEQFVDIRFATSEHTNAFQGENLGKRNQMGASLHAGTNKSHCLSSRISKSTRRNN